MSNQDLAQSHEYFLEFQVYKKHEAFINLHYIRDHILAKKLHQEGANKESNYFLLVNPCQGNKETADENKLNQKPSMSMSLDRVIVKVVSEHNIDSILNQTANPTLECLIRLRKYQLIQSMEPNPEGGYLIVLNPKSESRTVITDW